MKNPLQFIQEVKQEAFKVTWPTSKETLQGTLMVVAMAIVANTKTINDPIITSFLVGQVTLKASCFTL